MGRSGWTALLSVVVLSLGLHACMFVVLADNRDCSDHRLDELVGQPYRLLRVQDGIRQELGFVFDLRKDCTLVIPAGFRTLGVQAIELTHAHSAKRATLRIHTEGRDREGRPLFCTARFSTYDAMEFVCPAELGGRSYRLTPVEIEE